MKKDVAQMFLFGVRTENRSLKLENMIVMAALKCFENALAGHSRRAFLAKPGISLSLKPLSAHSA